MVSIRNDSRYKINDHERQAIEEAARLLRLTFGIRIYAVTIKPNHMRPEGIYAVNFVFDIRDSVKL